MSLPLPWVDKIFDKLTLTYGQQFLARWRDIDLNAVKSDWMHELSGFENAPHAIAYGLSNLPKLPPTVIEFRALCRLAPTTEVKQLEAPRADPARVASELAKLAPMLKPTAAPVDRLDWARRILQSVEDGAKRTPTVVKMARDALAGV